MGKAFAVFFRSFGLWWREWILLVFFNICWLILSLLIITAPPATAAMYVLARRTAHGELLEPRDGWIALRQVFVPAWKWGALNLVMAVVLYVNFTIYQNAEGLAWIVLRAAWAAIGLVWLALNLFYWPFWLAQSDQRLLTTFRNCAVFLLKQPLFGFGLLVLGALLSVVSVLLTLPFAAALMTWLALMGTLAIDEELQRVAT